MKKFMKKMWEKKDSKKGFTLVELIVVLVILAILAAIMIPSMVGWIDKAKEKQASIECRTYYLAAQTIAAEEYGKENTAPTTVDVTKAQQLAFPDNEDRVATSITVANGKVTGITGFSASDGKTYSFDGTKWNGPTS